MTKVETPEANPPLLRGSQAIKPMTRWAQKGQTKVFWNISGMASMHPTEILASFRRGFLSDS
jgi:hypothetical protein